MIQRGLAILIVLAAVLYLANCVVFKAQVNVCTGRREHSLFLWIWLNADADSKQCAQIFTDLDPLVLEVSKNQSDTANAIIAGVGFGENVYNELCTTPLTFEYIRRDGTLGSMPASGGDIFVHAKSNSQSKLFELTQLLLKTIPEGCVSKAEDQYSFLYKGCRDLTGFIDGTMNPSVEDRRDVALDAVGGSYALTQKWVHQLDKIASFDRVTKEGFVGRTLSSGEELVDKVSCSHVAKMTGGTAFQNPPTFRIYRQSQAYGSVEGPAGLFFIAFANSTANFDFMLDAMVGGGEDDCIFHMTQCVSGNYFYFPGVGELIELRNKCFV